MAAKTKSVGGKNYSASDFAYVGDPEDVSTWHLLVADAGHVQDAMARFDQTDLPADAKGAVAKKLLSLAKKHGMDASGFAAEHNLKATEAEQSFEEMQQALNAALLEKFGSDASGFQRYWLCETFPDYIIARSSDSELYQIPYSIGDDESLQLGDPLEVETAYVPVQQSARFAITKEAAVEADGWTWPVQVMQSGWAHGQINGQSIPHYFPREVVARVSEAVNGARFRRRHPQESEGDGSAFPELTAGYTSEGKMQGDAAFAKLNLLRNETGLRDQLVAAKEAGKLDLFGVSIFAFFGFRPGVQDGKKALIATSLGRYVGLDLCAEAGAGGKILPYAASKSMTGEIAQLQKEAIKKVSRQQTGGAGGSSSETPSAGTGRNFIGGQMKESILKVLEALRKIDSGRAAELEREFEGVSEDKHAEFFAKVSEAVSAKLPTAIASNDAQARAAADILSEAVRNARDRQDSEIMAKTRESLAAVKKMQFQSTMERKLTESKLSIPAAKLVREHFANASGEDQETVIDVFIGKVRESFAAYETVGRPSGSTIEVGRESRDKVQLGMDAMMGVKEAHKDRSVRPFRGIKEAYIFCTGDTDVRFEKGGFYRVSEAIGTADFPNILLNSMTKRMIQDYEELRISDGLDVLYTKATLGDYKSQDRIRMGYLSDLSTVAENGPYTELAKPTDEKISYTVAKRGNLVTISEETIRNDDLGKIAGYASRLGRAARHTLAADITAKFTTPPNYDPDGLAWFHATHTNLGSTALSSAELDVRKVALYKQTEKDSGNRLGLRLWGIMVPADLEPTARQINNNQSGTNNWYQMFGANGERILVNPLLTDVNDWYYYCDPSVAPFLEVGFLDGYDTPQIFIANLPTQGTQFTNDQLQYKAKFVWGVKPIDFRGVGKEVV